MCFLVTLLTLSIHHQPTYSLSTCLSLSSQTRLYEQFLKLTPRNHRYEVLVPSFSWLQHMKSSPSPSRPTNSVPAMYSLLLNWLGVQIVLISALARGQVRVFSLAILSNQQCTFSVLIIAELAGGADGANFCPDQRASIEPVTSSSTVQRTNHCTLKHPLIKSFLT